MRIRRFYINSYNFVLFLVSSKIKEKIRCVFAPGFAC